MKIVLDETRAARGMAELEEYLGEWTLRSDGTVVEDARYDALPYSGAAFAEFESRRCTDIPSLELHLGFDAPKQDGQGMPLSLAELTDSCTQRGMQNGGWFVFKKDSHWAYRSNEFSSQPVADAERRLGQQARALRDYGAVGRVVQSRARPWDLGLLNAGSSSHVLDQQLLRGLQQGPLHRARQFPERLPQARGWRSRSAPPPRWVRFERDGAAGCRSSCVFVTSHPGLLTSSPRRRSVSRLLHLVLPIGNDAH